MNTPRSSSALFAVRMMAVIAINICLPVGQAQQLPANGQSTTAVPRLVQFSGMVKEAAGKPIAGVTFALYKDQEGGAPIWMETQNVSLDESGRYSVPLGATRNEGLPKELFESGEARWLGVQPEGQPEQPRVLLLSVPYALKAADADTLGGKPVSAFLLNESAAVISGGAASTIVMPAAPGFAPEATAASPEVAPATACTAITADGTAGPNQVAKFTGPCAVHQSVIFDNGTTVNVGGVLQLPATGTATATTGFNSRPFDFLASSFNKTLSTAVNQHSRWQAEPVGNNTSNPSGKLSLLFGSGANTPAETGF